MVASATYEILLIEDNPADADLFRLALEESDIPATPHVATNGDEGLSFLENRGATGAGASVDLIVLDLNLPGKSGLEVLEELKQEMPIETTPILILSTSKNREEIREAYKLGANAYLAKRTDFKDIVSLVESLEEFWLTMAELPE